MKKHNNHTIYLAAPFFDSKQLLFNSLLIREFEKNDSLSVIAPQRDGFRYTELTESLNQLVQRKVITEDSIVKLREQLIYHLDLGYFLFKSDVVIAILDEPIDEGVMTEICYGKFYGKKVIGLRTDIKTPFGSPSDTYKGMHYFPGIECHDFFYQPIEHDDYINLVDKISTNVLELTKSIEKPVANNRFCPNEFQSSFVKNAHMLFNDIEDVNSYKSIENIVLKYRNSIERKDSDD